MSSLRVRVTKIEIPLQAQIRDIAVLHVASDLPGDMAARLRCPTPTDLVGGEWWSFGFPRGHWMGNSSSGVVGEDLSYGWVRLDGDSRYSVQPGYSGAALWSPEYGAVVGLVGQASGANSDACAFTLFEANRSLPDQKLGNLADWTVEAAGEAALAAWGWTLAQDPEAGRHWRPRARGVTVDSERGFRFRGRTAALTRIVNWMGSAEERRVLVVTGSPGVGKSAVLGRIVTTADSAIAASLPAEDDAVRAPIGSIACAVHTKGKTSLDVASEIARAASASLPAHVEDLPAALRSSLEAREIRQFIVVIDALDEAVSPEETRLVATRIILPLAETCADVGVRVLVGSRSRDDQGGLIEIFGPAAEEIDLDDAAYFHEADLSAYARATLILLGAERPGNPYADPNVAEPVADRIAELSDRNFLVAGLVARTHGLYDAVAVRPEEVSFTPTVSAALREYLYRLPPVGEAKAHDALAALAYAEAPGFSLDLWTTAIAAISGITIAAAQLKSFSLSSAANFLIETSSFGDGSQYRLFHQALNDALIADRGDIASKAIDERAIARAFIATGRASAWERASEYLLKSLPGHAQRGAVLDELLMDDDYLLHADLRRLIPIADQDASDASRYRAKLIRKTPQAIDATPDARTSLFSVTELQEGLGENYKTSSNKTPYRALWTTVEPRTEEVALEGTEGIVDAVAALEVNGRHILASGSSMGSIRISDPSSGETLRVLEGSLGGVLSLCSLRIGKRTLLASASETGDIMIWDSDSGRVEYSLSGANRIHVQSMCSVASGDSSYLAIINQEGRLSLWCPTDDDEYTVLEELDWVEAVCPLIFDDHEHLLCIAEGSALIISPVDGDVVHVLNEEFPQGEVSSVCPVEVDGLDAFACAFVDGAVNIFHAVSGELIKEMESASEAVRGICTVQSQRGNLLAGYRGNKISIWDPDSGQMIRTLAGHADNICSVCSVRVGLRSMIASGSVDSSVRLWDPDAVFTGQKLEEIRNGIVGIASIELESRAALLSASYSGVVRIHSASTGITFRNLGRYKKWVSAVSSARVAGRSISMIGDLNGVVHLVDSLSKETFREFRNHESPVTSIHPFKVNDWSLVATGDVSGKIRIWDPISGEAVSDIDDWFNHVFSLSSVRVSGEVLLACAGGALDPEREQSIALFDPVSGGFVDRLYEHTFQVRSVTEVLLGRKSVLVSCSDDADVIVWDPNLRSSLATLEGHRDCVRSACQIRIGQWDALATGGDDRTVRLWELGSWRFLLELPVYHPVTSLTQVDTVLVVGSDAGLLGLSVDPAWFRMAGG
jgi:WD40 repeat protein